MADYCYRHKDTETLLKCGQCGRPICVRCIVQHPVGIRCPECARPKPVAALEVSSLHYARAVAAAAVITVAGIVGMVVFSELVLSLGLAGYYLRWMALVGIGYALGAGVRLAVGGKRGRGLQWVAGVAMVVVFLAASSLVGLALDSLVGIGAVVVAVYVAVMQLRL